MDLPSGVVTFLMTDIEGSTRLWAEAPDAMRAALARHDAIAALAVGEHAGFLMKARGEGDSTFSVFARPTDGVAAACALQSALTAELWPEGAPLRVRIAVHTGEADLGVDNYYGAAVNRCARLRSIAHGGQVLISESAAGLVREALPEEVTLRDLGFQRLRDLAEPEHVWQLLHHSLPSDFPALRTIDSIPNNLPYQVNTFIGREAEMTKIRELLRGTRLLTLSGAGGVGKTRLALQTAAEMLYEYPDGVWLVELASLSDGALVLQALATALDVREEPGRALSETIASHLRGQRALIVLDNCEHLVDASTEMAEGMIRQCQDLKILATSREALRADGETVWRVPSLSVPHHTPGLEPRPEQLRQHAAVRLFIDRATKADPGFAMTIENAPAVAEICWRLDGIPLAVELAAARGRTFTPQQIVERLDQRFRLLTGGRRTATPRHQALEAAVDWSYDLLSESEKTLFSRLSAFAGGFTLEAAEAVCSCAPIREEDVPDLLDELVSKSLVIPGSGRYWLLQTLRDYGAQRLDESGYANAVRRSHAGHFAQLAEQGQCAVRGAERAEWLELMNAEHDNSRAALAWGIGCDPEAAARLASSMAWFWQVRGHWAEGCEWLSRVLALDELPTDLRLRLLDNVGDLYRLRGECGKARELHEDELALSRAVGDRRAEGNALNSLGNATHNQGDLPLARACYEEALAIRRELGDEAGAASVLHNLAIIASGEGDHATTRACCHASLEVYRRRGDTHRIAITLQVLGGVLVAQGDYAGARSAYEESLALLRELGDRSALANTLHGLGLLAHERGDYAAARPLYEESLAINREVGAKRFAANTLNNLGNVAREEGRYAEARALLEECLDTKREIGDRVGVAVSLANLGRVALAEGDREAARRLMGEALDLQREAGDQQGAAMTLIGLGPVALADGDVASARAHLVAGAKVLLEASEQPGMVAALAELARVALADGDIGDAARWFAAAEAARDRLGTRLEPSARPGVESACPTIREALGDAAFAAAWEEGTALPLEQALRLALGRDTPQG